MKIILKLFLAVLSSHIILIPSAYPIQIENKTEFRLDARGDDGDIEVSKLSAVRHISSLNLAASGFCEGQWNFDISDWEKATAGIDLKTNFLKYLRYSQSIQLISGKILDYMAFEAHNQSIETVSAIQLVVPIFKNLFNKRINIQFDEEYSFNLEESQAGLNEVGIKINYSFSTNKTLGIGWWHTDRIHNFDTDYASTSFTLKF